MSTVLPAVNSAASVLPRSTVGGTLASSTADESQDRFLKLLVTQMRNQDPMNPMDNAQVTTQLAQISTVGGIDKLNSSLSAMSSAMSATQNASLIGRTVVVASDLVRFGGTSPVTVGVELASAADKVDVTIVDAGGQTVRSMAFGALPQGTSTFEWDGRNNAGAKVAAGPWHAGIGIKCPVALRRCASQQRARELLAAGVFRRWRMWQEVCWRQWRF